jgi:predicted DNA-binding protein YlxM (UPF0122 family)
MERKNMSLNNLRTEGIALPPIETEEGLTAKDIMDKIRSFYIRFEKYSGESADFMEGYFLELLRDYPKSLCSRNMTESEKQLITMIYVESKPNPESEDKDPWPGYSYEDLAVMFDISKATVHQAIRQKETEAKRLLEEARLKQTAKKIALAELVAEEKEKLKLEQKNETIEQTTEQTPQNPGGG